MFKLSIQQEIINTLEQDNFVKEDFHIKEAFNSLIFTYKNYSGCTFSIDSMATREVSDDAFLGTKTTVYKVTMSPGKHKESEDHFHAIEAMRFPIGDWLTYIKDELKARRAQNWEKEKEGVTEKVDKYFKDEIEETNKIFSEPEIKDVEQDIDHWKGQVETILEDAYGKISTLENQVAHMQKQLDSLKNDAQFQTKTAYTKSVFKKLGLLMLTYPEATKNIFEMAQALVPPEYHSLLTSDLAATLQAPTQFFLTGIQKEEE